MWRNNFVFPRYVKGSRWWSWWWHYLCYCFGSRTTPGKNSTLAPYYCEWFWAVEVIQPFITFICVLFYWQEAESLIAKKIHPQTIIAGWREATKAAREALLTSAVDHGLVYQDSVGKVWSRGRWETCMSMVLLPYPIYMSPPGIAFLISAS